MADITLSLSLSLSLSVRGVCVCNHQEGHLPVVKYLIEDAKANAQCETTEFDTPYALALSRGRKDVSDYLKDIAGVLPFVKSVVVKEVEKRR